MNGPDAVAAIAADAGSAAVAPAARPEASELAGPSFAELLAQGLNNVEARVDHANALVRAFAVDDSVPIHEVTIALEEARLAVEFAMQVRSRLVDGYREIMNMQL